MVSLRRIEKEDLGELFRFRNDQRIYRWCRQNDALHRAGHESWYEWQAHDQSVSMYAVCDESGTLIGACGLTDIDRLNSRAEFSLYIGHEHNGRGYGRRALLCLLEKAFNAHNLNCVYGETFKGNPAASIFMTVGFRYEGARRQFYYRDGAYIDAHLYSISRDEWRLINGAPGYSVKPIGPDILDSRIPAAQPD